MAESNLDGCLSAITIVFCIAFCGAMCFVSNQSCKPSTFQPGDVIQVKGVPSSQKGRVIFLRCIDGKNKIEIRTQKMKYISISEHSFDEFEKVEEDKNGTSRREREN